VRALRRGARCHRLPPGEGGRSLNSPGTSDKRWVALLIALLVIVIDRVTKLWVVAHITSGHAITVIPGVFRITHVLNTGAAFSMFEGSRNPNTVRYALIIFSLAAIAGVLIALW